MYPDTIEQRYNTKVQQKHNPAKTEQRYNTKIQQKHNPDTIEQRYNTKIQQKHNPECCIVVLLYLDYVFVVLQLVTNVALIEYT
jgi:hypothetical protein